MSRAHPSVFSNASAVSVPESRPAVIGVDMGGTTSKFGLLTEHGKRLEMFHSLPTGAHRARTEVLKDMTDAIVALAENAAASGNPVASVGLGLPAAMSRSGHVEVLPNFAPGWTGVSVASELADSTGLQVVSINDARAFTLAEATFGAGSGVQSVLGVTLGTGVGGGLVLDGKLYLGESGKAGELGHTVVDHNGPLCGCGSRGCLETYASATALIASVTRGFLQGTTSRLCELADYQLTRVTPELIAQAAHEGDAACQDAIERLAVVLGTSIASVVTLLAVERIVIGGGLVGLDELLIPTVKQTLKRYARLAGPDSHIVVRAELGSEAGALGAALVARDGSESKIPMKSSRL